MKAIVFITLLILLSPFSSNAEEEEKLIYESLDFEVRYFNAITKSAVVLQEYFSKYPESDHEKIINTDKFINRVLKKELYEVANTYIDQQNLSPTLKEKFLKRLESIRYKNIAYQSSKYIKNRHYYLRKYGIGFCLAMIIGNTVNVVAPVILMQLGLNYWVGVSLAMPYGTVLAGLTIPAVFIKRWYKERNALGVNYPDYVRMKRQIAKRLKSISHQDLFFPVKPTGVLSEKILTIQKTRIYDKVANFFNIGVNGSNYITIYNFIKINNIKDEYTKWVTTQKSLSKQEKALLLVYHIFETSDEKIQALFITEFSTYFSVRPKLPRLYRLKDWTKLLISASSGQEVAKVMSLVPPGIPPLVIIQVWEEVALPQLIKHIPMKYGALNSLKAELGALRALSSSKAHRETWNHAFAKLFSQKVNPLITGYNQFCHKNQKDFFHFLLNNPL